MRKPILREEVQTPCS